MKKYGFIVITLLFLALASMPATANAMPMIEIIESYDIELNELTISVENNVLHICGANGQTVQIYKITGVQVLSASLDSEDVSINLDLPKGCYIVKVGKVARKIFLG